MCLRAEARQRGGVWREKKFSGLNLQIRGKACQAKLVNLTGKVTLLYRYSESLEIHSNGCRTTKFRITSSTVGCVVIQVTSLVNRLAARTLDIAEIQLAGLKASTTTIVRIHHVFRALPYVVSTFRPANEQRSRHREKRAPVHSGILHLRSL